MTRWTSAFLRQEVRALPVELFRVAAGMLLAVYFLSLCHEVPDYSAADGLIDHVLLRQVLWFTRFTLFSPGVPDSIFTIVYGLAALAAILIAAGVRTKLCAGYAYLVAVSAYRWNFIVMYVDDAIMHLLLFWLLLLPVGRTFTLAEIWREGVVGAWRRACAATAPGLGVRCFQANVCLVYLVAGLWKLESPLWRSGLALYASLRLPIARCPDCWAPADLPLLVILNHLALVVEPAIPLLLLLPRGNPLKWLGLALQIGFHLGIIAFLPIPFANLACLSAAILFFGAEIASAGARWATVPLLPLANRERTDAADRCALGVLAVLAVAMTRRLPLLGAFSHQAVVALWIVGLAQDYQLFNWIDSKNYAGASTIWIADAGPAPHRENGEAFFPPPVRGALLQSYLHGVRWLRIPDSDMPALKSSILQRAADRYCRASPRSGTISFWTATQRIDADNLDLHRPESRLVVEFRCRGRVALICRSLADPDAAGCPREVSSPLQRG